MKSIMEEQYFLISIVRLLCVGIFVELVSFQGIYRNRHIILVK